VNKDGKRRTGFELLSFPDVKMAQLSELFDGVHDFPPEILEQVERDALYATYIDRQNRDAEALRRDEAVKIPVDFNFDALSGLSNELKHKLSEARPETLAEASKVDGITPAALTLLLAKVRSIRAKVS